MIIKRDILFTPSNAVRQLHIYLPESYSQGQEQYPVMYFFDGHNLLVTKTPPSARAGA